ncbi:MAG: hypothetical protein KJ600_00900 [Nanoarchaeota archaeon]|nr:hypothetical protein [Nanoarchaeota archaeon]MBU1103100.1 hypothetical protein [Nanoarchaeota archaeon]
MVRLKRGDRRWMGEREEFPYAPNEKPLWQVLAVFARNLEPEERRELYQHVMENKRTSSWIRSSPEREIPHYAVVFRGNARATPSEVKNFQLRVYRALPEDLWQELGSEVQERFELMLVKQEKARKENWRSKRRVG